MLATFADARAPEGALDLAVEVGDSLMAHRRRYSVATNRSTVIDLLALDDRNPRSVFFQLTEIKNQIAMLPGSDAAGPMPPLPRRVLEMHTGLAVRSPEELTSEGLLKQRGETAALSGLIAETYFGWQGARSLRKGQGPPPCSTASPPASTMPTTSPRCWGAPCCA